MPKKPKEAELSHCVFDEDRSHRYCLTHTWRDPELPSYVEPKVVMWIGLNPSVANETQLDNTLRRVRAYSKAWGYDTFVMTNLYAFIATDPKIMLAAPDPVGVENDYHITKCADRASLIVAMWGNHGSHLGRAAHVTQMLAGRLTALKINADSSPSHCLYLPKTLTPQPYGLILAATPVSP